MELILKSLYMLITYLYILLDTALICSINIKKRVVLIILALSITITFSFSTLCTLALCFTE